eukprot:1091013-Prymnesium_polylepis.2
MPSSPMPDACSSHSSCPSSNSSPSCVPRASWRGGRCELGCAASRPWAGDACGARGGGATMRSRCKNVHGRPATVGARDGCCGAAPPERLSLIRRWSTWSTSTAFGYVSQLGALGVRFSRLPSLGAHTVVCVCVCVLRVDGVCVRHAPNLGARRCRVSGHLNSFQIHPFSHPSPRPAGSRDIGRPRGFPMPSSSSGTWWPIRIKSPGLA